jgi:putative tryptophan/tyrosine transport system substrate-binding protein
MACGTDQVSLGLAANLSRRGGNVTGLASINSDLMAKRFELLREIVPKMSRLAVGHADNAPSMASVRDLEVSAAKSRVGFQSFGIRSTEDLGEVFSAMAKDRFDGLIVVNSRFIYAERTRPVDLALKYKVPTMYGAAEYAEAGGLVSYAPSYSRMFRQAAIYVDKILKGADPGDMPIEQPTTIELVINASTARSIAVTIPVSMLARADRVIQ